MKIQPLDNGPLMINGEADIVDGKGKLLEKKEQCYLCRCGLSANQPYCSGAHQGKFMNEVRAK